MSESIELVACSRCEGGGVISATIALRAMGRTPNRAARRAWGKDETCSACQGTGSVPKPEETIDADGRVNIDALLRVLRKGSPLPDQAIERFPQ